MNKIYLQLSGGLGNQLFQFAFAKNLSIKLNRKLLIETRSGLNDRYLRKQELPESLIRKYKNNSFIVYLIFKIEKFLKFFFKKKIITNRLWGIIYDDRYKIKFDKKFLSHINNQKNIYIMGYYQSPKYFMDNLIEIKKSIMNSIKINFRYKKLFNIAKTKWFFDDNRNFSILFQIIKNHIFIKRTGTICCNIIAITKTCKNIIIKYIFNCIRCFVFIYYSKII